MQTKEISALFQAVVAVGRQCIYCGKRANSADHVVPVHAGGVHKAENLVPACQKCNSTKGKKRLTPATEIHALQYAFITAPTVREVARNLIVTKSQAFPIGLVF